MKDFIKSLQRPDNKTLIEAILEGYNVIFESTQINKFPISALIKQSKKFKTFEEFKKFYTVEIYHGYYWHLTNDPDFKISSEIGPRDMSSISAGSQGERGALMMTSHLEYWDSHYNSEGIIRPYAVLLDASDIDPVHLKQVSRGFGNEVYVHPDAAKKLKIIGVYNIKYAKQLDKKFDNIIPQSEKELYNLWSNAQGQSTHGMDEAVGIGDTIFENYTNELGYLKKYLESDPIPILAHDYHQMIEPWAEMNDYTFPDNIKNLETYEKIEWLEKNDPKTFKEYGEFVTNEANREGHSKVQFDRDPKLLINKWLIHFTDNPYDVWKEGFKYGTDDYERLGLTTSYKKTSKTGGTFAFAYSADNFDRYYRNRHGFKYGTGAVVFQASGLYVRHDGDEEYQVIFDTSTAKNIMVIEFDENNDPYVESKNRKILYKANNPDMNDNEKFTSCVDWIITHFDQYRKAHSIKT